MNKANYDVEAGREKGAFGERVGDDGAVHAETLTVGETWYAKTQRFVTKFGVEARGIERVPDDERTDSSMSKTGTLVCIHL